MNKNKKHEENDIVYCIDESNYEIHLTKRKKYNIHQVGKGSKKGKIRVKSDLGRLVWFSEIHFSKVNQPEIKSINLDDEIEDGENECIEVTITFEDNQKRWITFMTTKYLKELLVRQNDYFCSSRIVYVNSLNPSIVEKIILDLDKNNELFTSTREY